LTGIYGSDSRISEPKILHYLNYHMLSIVYSFYIYFSYVSCINYSIIMVVANGLESTVSYYLDPDYSNYFSEIP